MIRLGVPDNVRWLAIVLDGANGTQHELARSSDGLVGVPQMLLHTVLDCPLPSPSPSPVQTWDMVNTCTDTWLTVGHGSFSHPLVELSDAETREVDIPEAVLRTGSKAHRVPAERLTNAIDAPVQMDHAFVLNVADHVVRAIFQRRQLLGEGPVTDPIARDGWNQAECLMRSHRVVAGPALVERRLGVPQVGEDAALQQLGLQRAMEALVLALGLRGGADGSDPATPPRLLRGNAAATCTRSVG